MLFEQIWKLLVRMPVNMANENNNAGGQVDYSFSSEITKI